MSKFKKFMITLGAVVIAGVFYQETQPHYENCSYEILEEEDGAFAKCSCGTIYIGSRDFLKQIPKEEGVILVEDQRRSEDRDPNMKIYDSCFFDSAEDMKKNVVQMLTLIMKMRSIMILFFYKNFFVYNKRTFIFQKVLYIFPT